MLGAKREGNSGADDLERTPGDLSHAAANVKFITTMPQ